RLPTARLRPQEAPELFLFWLFDDRVVRLGRRDAIGNRLVRPFIRRPIRRHRWRQGFGWLARIRWLRQRFSVCEIVVRCLPFFGSRTSVSEEITGPEKRVIGLRRVARFVGMFEPRLVIWIDRVLAR